MFLFFNHQKTWQRSCRQNAIPLRSSSQRAPCLRIHHSLILRSPHPLLSSPPLPSLSVLLFLSSWVPPFSVCSLLAFPCSCAWWSLLRFSPWVSCEMRWVLFYTGVFSGLSPPRKRSFVSSVCSPPVSSTGKTECCRRSIPEVFQRTGTCSEVRAPPHLGRCSSPGAGC